MEILIKRIDKVSENHSKVLVECEYGYIWMKWQDDTFPIIGNKYFVEFSLPYKLKWGKDIFPTKKTSFLIQQKKTETEIFCILLKVENETAFIKLGNSLLLAQLNSNEGKNNIFVCIKVPEIIIYDTKI